MRFSLYQFLTRYRPSPFPVIQEPKAHQAWQSVLSLLNAPDRRRFILQRIGNGNPLPVSYFW
ncbi:hypothetical protein [Intestinirhabdus alba]|uniref:Uncharacterized protein n=1 Tax=Intestinirhabdus alba TaxID=2899544 RepID=A0A6L6INY0_9ENTR|nr:hypothetical protein [Intestinirhabdus alba]MTH46483.1 hypothetical protein [Intestinirhabdus alba]